MKTTGVEIIRKALQEMPLTPGVYRMLDEKGAALYIGKARNLKNRVSTYVQPLGERMQRMVMQTAQLEITPTRSEAEALLLEANQVQALKPHYNILLRDDKSFPYIQLSGDHAYPRIGKYRGDKKEKGKYFGPFVSAGAVNETITLLQRIFLLRPCSDTMFKSRTRPCLQYQIKRCSAPCVGKVSESDYEGLLKQAHDFLSGKSRDLQDKLNADMQAASAAQDFETAALLRDRIRALTQVQQQQQNIHARSFEDADIVALARDRDEACVQVFCFRGGGNFGSRSFFPQHTAGSTDAEIISNFLAQFYQKQVPPREVVVSQPLEDTALLEEALSIQADAKVSVVTPLKGPKRDFMNFAMKSAKEALTRQLAQKATQVEVLEGVQALFGLEETPQRIEVYDNSHIMGTMAVGAMIVAGPEGWSKKAYRRFAIKSQETVPGDDYAMMREVLKRRFSKLQASGQLAESEARPDLVLIDGGAGHLQAAREIFDELGLNIPYVCISKGVDRNAGREWFHMVGREPFQLPPNDPVLHYLQRLRDEAHRFAIGFHRLKRSKAIRVSEIDAIPAIGMRRKQALLHHFGSAKAIAGASIKDLQQVEGISNGIARKIYHYYHGEA